MKDNYIEELRLSVIPSEILRVIVTPWFDLSMRMGREYILKNFCGLMVLVKEPFALETDSVAE
jgi:hypothetical protein